MGHSEIKSGDAQLAQLNEIVMIEKNAHFSPWSIKSFDEAIKAKNIFKVFLENKKIFGYYVANIAIDQCEILNITIAKEKQGIGRGNLLLKNLISLCSEKNISNIFLEVRASNVNAIKLYEKNGFNEVGIRHNYYQKENGKEDGLLMGYTFD